MDRVPLAPPELAADILIRIATSGRVTDKTWKIEMLEDAFQLAGHATYPIRLLRGFAERQAMDIGRQTDHVHSSANPPGPSRADRPTLPEQLGFSHARLPKGHAPAGSQQNSRSA